MSTTHSNDTLVSLSRPHNPISIAQTTPTQFRISIKTKELHSDFFSSRTDYRTAWYSNHADAIEDACKWLWKSNQNDYAEISEIDLKWKSELDPHYANANNEINSKIKSDLGALIKMARDLGRPYHIKMVEKCN
jgi:hypothetical protein